MPQPNVELGTVVSLTQQGVERECLIAQCGVGRSRILTQHGVGRGHILSLTWGWVRVCHVPFYGWISKKI